MKDLGNLENWTNNELSRVIIQALYGSSEPFAADHFKVIRLARRRKAHLVKQAEQAINILNR